MSLSTLSSTASTLPKEVDHIKFSDIVVVMKWQFWLELAYNSWNQYLITTTLQGKVESKISIS